VGDAQAVPQAHRPNPRDDVVLDDQIAWLREVEDESAPDVDLTGGEFAVGDLEPRVEDDGVVDEERRLMPFDFAPAVQTGSED
jgi:hypothetical protein